MLRFSFKQEPLLFRGAQNADAQVIGEELMRIKEANNGLLTAEDTWEAARNRRNPLHRHVEWNTAVAAKAYQLDQCRELIRVIRVVDTDRDERERRAFVNVTDRDKGRAYRDVGEILDSRALQLLVLVAAERELAAWEARYQDLVEICDMVRGARTQLAAMRAAAEAEAHP